MSKDENKNSNGNSEKLRNVVLWLIRIGSVLVVVILAYTNLCERANLLELRQKYTDEKAEETKQSFKEHCVIEAARDKLTGEKIVSIDKSLHGMKIEMTHINQGIEAIQKKLP